ncbi:methyltransferase domain-containing protein [Oxalobacteraceae bacterium OM1]|nr:methyltransferase domain-containing protein [Oxalobacteraceae bacterium OM1]
MTLHAGDKAFTGSIAKLYESCLVPLLFQPYAQDLAERLAGHALARVIELAAGTGVVTRELARRLPASVDIVATDLNPGMLEEAAARGTARPVEWRQADAMHIPYGDESFDAVVCQFGVMFLPDKVRAFEEMRRVLRPGGMLLFNVWDAIEVNDFACAVTAAMAQRYPEDPPRFFARIPHGYHDRDAIVRDLELAGFGIPRIDTLEARSRAESARAAAVGLCQGTPLRNEIEERDAGGLEAATEDAARALGARFGSGVVEGRMRAHVVVVPK